MGESRNVGMAAAVAGGYALGRSKKGRVALTAAALLVGKGLSPRHMVSGGLRKLPGVPGKNSEEPSETEEEQHHNPLARAVRTAASSAANRPLTALTDTLHERTLGLIGEPEPEEDTADTDGEPEEDADRHGEESEDEAAPQKSRAKPEPPAEPRGRSRAPEKNGEKSSPKSAPKRATPRKPVVSRKQSASAKRPERKSAPAQRSSARKDMPTKKSASRSRRER